MKVYGKVENALVMTKKAEQGKKDPTKTYYRLGIVKDDELGESRCEESVFLSVDKYQTYNFGMCYNSEYDTVVLETCYPVDPVIPVPDPILSVNAPVYAPADIAAASVPVETSMENTSTEISVDTDVKEEKKSKK